MPYKESERVAQAAYDSQDAGAFYSQIWGGDDIHLGMYESPDEPIADASYNEVPADDGVADLVWSQDAFLHAADRKQPLAEAARVLKPGGEFLFTDPMAADGVNAAELSGVLARLNLSSLASPGEYKQLAAEVGFEVEEFEDLTHFLPQHYGRVLEETQANAEELLKTANQQYLDGMMKGLQHWVDAGNRGLLSWGIFHFRKK